VLNSRKPLVDVDKSGVDTGRNIAILAAMGANNAPKKNEPRKRVMARQLA
jgi:hypothetical protein